ncbi:glycosyltransferase [Rhodophyticola sp. MJ-SS7]|nr:glycosyltransferase [Rhodophyticola sp. MJ-SS7]
MTCAPGKGSAILWIDCFCSNDYEVLTYVSMSEQRIGLAMDVTVAFIFRERVSQTLECLDALIPTLPPGVPLICFDNASPPEIATGIKARSKKHEFSLVRSEKQLTPNEQRNIVLDRINSRYVIFIDNDCSVSSNWIEALVACAVQTGAGIVGPLYLEEVAGNVRVHMFGGVARDADEDGRPCFIERHFHSHQPVTKDIRNREAFESELIEFHCALIDTRIFESIGKLDPELMSLGEHSDLCIQARKRGFKVYIEPKSVVTYQIPARLDPLDRSHFACRWSESWNAHSVSRLAEKYHLERDAITGYERWANFHRTRAQLQFPFIKRNFGRRVHGKFQKALRPFNKSWNRLRYPLQSRSERANVQLNVLKYD